MACSACGPDTTHALIRSGLPRWRWFGPPVGQIREYARCLICSTQRSLEDEVSWADAVRGSDELSIGADPR